MKLLKRTLALTLSAAMVLGLLSGCGSDVSANVLNVYNWGEYIDTDLLDRHSAVAVAVRLDHAQHGRLRGLADDAVVMFDGTEVDLRPGAMLVWLHFSSSPDFRRYPPFS